MDAEIIFKIANTIVLPFWLTMIFAPKWNWTMKLANSPWVPLALALAYAALIIPDLDKILPMVAQPDLQLLIQGFQSPTAMTAGWIHYLVFDLLIGQSIYRRSRKLGTHPLVAGITLFLTLMFGPIGWAVSLFSLKFGNSPTNFPKNQSVP